MAVTDLSALVPSINGGASMSAGNTISPTPSFGAAGFDSESEPPTKDVPDIAAAPADDHAKFVHSGADDAFAGHGFDYPDVDGEGWSPTSA
jgi:hypothetical protein